MTVPTIATVELVGDPGLPLLVCGPSLGTSATALWSPVAGLLADSFHVVGWDLPGHGTSPAPTGPFTAEEVAVSVLDAVDGILSSRGEAGGTFAVAGNSFGGSTALQLLLDAPARVSRAVLVCTGAQIGEASTYRARAALVRESGTNAAVVGSSQRWFGPGFAEREPVLAEELLQSLRDADNEGYAATCEALAAFDVRDRLGEIAAPVLAIAGVEDTIAPPASADAIAAGVRHGRAVVLPGVSHLAPAEAPDAVAALVREHLAFGGGRDLYDAGMKVRREVLGDAHVDRANSAITRLTRDFQELITQYAWGSVWTRPGLDRRSRSISALTALVARGHHEELALHLRAARTNGLSDDEIAEVLLQTAIYCGVPDANTAFRIAQQVLAESMPADSPEQP
jgi:3-oxoadipate enol-lactonase / 4-carboxymuconolactone decarboxylase